ncbi:MAG: iron ABC transporter permease [Pseudomonadota bacterium]
MNQTLRTAAIPALIVAAICLLPQIGVLVAALSGTLETLRGLAETVLWRYTGTTLILVVLVGVGTMLIGTGAAWLVVTREFPARRLLEVLLVLPLAFPAYVLAYAYTHVLDHPGIVQTTLRDLTGWGPRDYWFPEIRSVGGAAAMLTLVLYPYVYLLARASFKQQAAAPYYAALSLGQSPLGAFLRVSLPMARPAIAAGALLAVMETIADFGTVAHFGVQTFATGIYTSWFSMFDRAAAAQLAMGLLAFALLFAALERFSRGRAQFAGKGRADAFIRQPLPAAKGWAASAACALPVLLGVVVPVVALSAMATQSEQTLLSTRYLNFATNSLLLGVVAAVVTVTAAVLLGTYHRIARSRLSGAALAVSRIGYAVPGGVIAVGLLVPMAGFDNWFDAQMREAFGISTGLLITGSIWLMIAAYMIRFIAAAVGAYEGGLETVTTNVDAAARVLGRTGWGTVRDIHVPILRRSLLTALLIVFVDTIKELPATLILRPFNYDTLAVQAFRLASDERLEGAAVPSLVIAAIGLIPVILLCRQIGERRLPRSNALTT